LESAGDEAFVLSFTHLSRHHHCRQGVGECVSEQASYVGGQTGERRAERRETTALTKRILIPGAKVSEPMQGGDLFQPHAPRATILHVLVWDGRGRSGEVER
jgi:hypothetical protein